MPETGTYGQGRGLQWTGSFYVHAGAGSSGGTECRWLFLSAGALFVGGAIGMEMLAGVIFDAAGSYEAGLGSLARSFAQAVEEMLEMPAEPTRSVQRRMT